MGFGDSFIKWIPLLYTNPRCSVMVNGHISPFFSPSRGVRQGCPLSPLLYALSMEVLACNIRVSPVVQGITLPGVTTPLPVFSLYAEDVSIIVSVIVSSVRAMEEVFHTYSRFEKGTGSKFQWTSNKIKVLGTFIGNGNLDEANWCPCVDAVAKCVSAWSSRHLSYGGRALISNAPALARVWYMAILLPIPGWAVGKLNRIIFSFFWKGKKDLVSRTVVIQSPSCGGFGIVPPYLKSQALLLQWVKRFWAASYGWRLFLAYWTVRFSCLSRRGPCVSFFV